MILIKQLYLKVIDGSLNFNSNGSNDLNNTNQLKQKLQIIYPIQV